MKAKPVVLAAMRADRGSHRRPQTKGGAMRRAGISVAIIAVVLATSMPATAVNGGLDGNAHPNVGVMLGLDPEGEIIEFCIGVLISPTEFLTNFNCPSAVDFVRSIGGRTVISFDPVFWPPEEARWRTVEAGYFHPDANPTNGTMEYGIAVLARPVRGIAPAELPTLQQLASVDKKTQPLTVVGYGSPDGARRAATTTIAAIDPTTIEVLNNTNATGQGGPCGDGGAPFFLGDSNVVVGVSDGETGHGHCNSISWAFRTDIEAARSFLDDFVSLP